VGGRRQPDRVLPGEARYAQDDQQQSDEDHDAEDHGTAALPAKLPVGAGPPTLLLRHLP
jgi:hypothetical protein